MNHHTDPINEKAPSAINTEGLATDATNELNFATGTRHRKTIATQVAQLEIQGDTVHRLKDGGFLVCKYRHTFHANDFSELQAFARRLGISQ